RLRERLELEPQAYVVAGHFLRIHVRAVAEASPRSGQRNREARLLHRPDGEALRHDHALGAAPAPGEHDETEKEHGTSAHAARHSRLLPWKASPSCTRISAARLPRTSCGVSRTSRE